MQAAVKVKFGFGGCFASGFIKSEFEKNKFGFGDFKQKAENSALNGGFASIFSKFQRVIKVKFGFDAPQTALNF